MFNFKNGVRLLITGLLVAIGASTANAWYPGKSTSDKFLNGNLEWAVPAGGGGGGGSSPFTNATATTSVAFPFGLTVTTITINSLPYYFPTTSPGSGRRLFVYENGNISIEPLITDGAQYGSSGTFTATQNFTSPSGITITYGVSAGSITLTGLSANRLVMTDGSKLLSNGYVFERLLIRGADMVQGTNSSIDTTSTARTYASVKYSGSTDQLANYADYTFIVPSDYNNSVDWILSGLADRLSAADTGKRRYVISLAVVAASASADSPTFGNAINIDMTADASGASADLEKNVSGITLTGWKTAVAAGDVIIIRLARDGDDGTNDTSTVDSNVLAALIKFGVNQ